MRYIELNPVRAEMVTQPSEYPWSSYRHTALGRPDDIMTNHPLYHALGATPQERQTAYREFFTGQVADKTLDAIRGTTNKGWGLGNNRFRERIATQLARRVAPKARGGDRRSAEYKRRQSTNRV